MKKVQLLLSVWIIFILVGCSKKPSASFKADNVELELGQAVTFINTSENSSTYFWDFGDGRTSTDQSPCHLYNKVGNYEVTLIAYSNDMKNSSKKYVSIIVSQTELKFTGIINGVPKTFVNDGINTSVQVTNFLSVSPPISEYQLTFAFQDRPGGISPRIEFGIGKLAFINTMTELQRYNSFVNFIAVKSYPFASSVTIPADGVVIKYTDENFANWASNLGSGNQTGSNFSITSVKYITSKSENPVVFFTAEFKIKLYSQQGGMQEITDGKVSGIFFSP